MILCKATNEYITFSLQENDAVVPFSEWGCKDDGEIYANLLEEFIDNGQAFKTENGCTVSYDAIYKMTHAERRVLNIPPFYPFKIELSHNGLLAEKDFTYKVIFCKNRLGKRFKMEREGAIIQVDNERFLLNRTQFKLVKMIDEVNSRPETNKSFNENLTAFNQVKSLAQSDAGVLLDKYLSSEAVFVPKTLKIKVNQLDSDLYEVIPSINSPLADQFERYLSSRNEVPENLALSPEEGSSRVRVVLNEEKQATIRTIRKHYSRASSTQLEELVANPVSFLDPEQCDLSVFYSERVIKIGLYKPKIYPFVCPYSSEWIPPIYSVEDRINGNSKLAFQSEEELQAFITEIRTAVANDEPSLTFKNIQLNTEDARKIAQDAQLQFDKQKKKEKKEEKKVLIVEDNADSLGYSEKFTKEERKESYSFYPIPGLHPDITLRPHQIEGIAWMQDLVSQKEKGCLLADDMWLGKTIQLLSLIDWYDKSHPANRKPYLIVAPVSLLENWEQEYKKFFTRPRIPSITIDSKVAKHYGKGIDERLITYLQNHQIVLTNYETVRGYQLSFCAAKFAMIILDETQKIKNPGTLITSSVKALQGDFKVAMTGTPVENSMVDLWCIMDFAVPGLLGNCKEFAVKYQHPLENAGTNIKMLGQQVRKEMGKYFLRRLKSDVAKDLPNKEIVTIEEEMPEDQKLAYKRIIKEAIDERESGHPTKGYILNCIQRLKLISDHPFIENEQYLNASVDELIDTSAKLKASMPVLYRIKELKEKAIIFTERRDMQQIWKRILKLSFSINAHIINGTTSTSKSRRSDPTRLSRQEAIDEFQSKNGFNVIIMSPIAAGMGLNVTGANHVIHYSRHWNPAKENQATDRAYRIGQDKDVHVYYPMAIYKGMTTFDQTLDELLKRKSNLAEATLYPSYQISVDILEDMFNKLTSC